MQVKHRIWRQTFYSADCKHSGITSKISLTSWCGGLQKATRWPRAVWSHQNRPFNRNPTIVTMSWYNSRRGISCKNLQPNEFAWLKRGLSNERKTKRQLWLNASTCAATTASAMIWYPNKTRRTAARQNSTSTKNGQTCSRRRNVQY